MGESQNIIKAAMEDKAFADGRRLRRTLKAGDLFLADNERYALAAPLDEFAAIAVMRVKRKDLIDMVNSIYASVILLKALTELTEEGVLLVDNMNRKKVKVGGFQAEVISKSKRSVKSLLREDWHIIDNSILVARALEKKLEEVKVGG